MKTWIKSLAWLLMLCMALSMAVACTTEPEDETPGGDQLAPWVDYASQLTLDQSSGTLQIEATVRYFIDGDTTHFYVDPSICTDGILQARYLAINTPESTGKIEEWGKAAAAFTRSKLEGATSIILESDDGKWNIDSTG